ncbi:MAG: hypothetical protein M0C28_33040 [Candidatus Moduliflexus flocculans]|nr:hypothetical protein [Candidatus Moduliflexus flocculans]
MTGGKLVLHRPGGDLFRGLLRRRTSSPTPSATRIGCISQALVKGLERHGPSAPPGRAPRRRPTSRGPCPASPSRPATRSRSAAGRSSAAPRSGPDPLFLQHGSIPLEKDEALLGRRRPGPASRAESLGMTSLSEALGRPVDFDAAVGPLVQGFAELFGVAFERFALGPDDREAVRGLQASQVRRRRLDLPGRRPAAPVDILLRNRVLHSARSEVDAMNEVEELSKLDPAGPAAAQARSSSTTSTRASSRTSISSSAAAPSSTSSRRAISVLNPTPDEGITEFITRNEALLDYLKEAIVQNLAVYSVLVDISSYFIEQNNGLVLARLRERDSERPALRDQVLHPLAQGASVPLRGQDLHRPGFPRPVQPQPEVLRRQGLDRLAQGPVRAAVRAGRGQAEKAQDFGSYFQEIGESVNELHNEGPAHPPEPAAAPRFRQALRQATSSTSTPSTGRSTTTSSSSTTRSPSSRTSSASRSAPTSCATSRSTRRT